jgi:protein subunit release factor A
MDEQDCRIDVYRAGWNTSPLVRVTHLPTGLEVSVSESPATFRNREMALALLSELVAQKTSEAN